MKKNKDTVAKKAEQKKSPSAESPNQLTERKKSPSAERPNEHTERKMFEMKVDLLKQQLAAADENYKLCKAELQSAKSEFKEEVNSKEAWVGHLKRELQREKERCLDAQERLQTVKDLDERNERWALKKLEMLDRKSENTKRLFLLQKQELEDKLSSLEPVRLARNRQTAKLKKLEDALAEKKAAQRQKSREVEATMVDKLVRQKEDFERKCKEITNEFLESWKLRFPVDAKNQLEENVRLRALCRKATDDLLRAQDRNKILTDKQKSLDIDLEMQDLAEKDIETRKASLDRRLQDLTQVYKDLLTENERRMENNFSEASTSAGCEKAEFTRDHDAVGQRLLGKNLGAAFDSRSYKKEDEMKSDLRASITTDRPHEEIKHQNKQKQILLSKKHSFPPKDKETGSPGIHQEHSLPMTGPSRDMTGMRKMNTTRKHETEQFQLEYVDNDVDSILVAQAEYKKSLEQKIAENIDRNGVMVSALLRAGQIVETRCSRAENSEQVELNCDLLHQFRMILDLCPEESEK